MNDLEKTPEQKREEQRQGFLIDKLIMIDTLESCLDLNSEDAEDLEYQKEGSGLSQCEEEILQEMKSDEKEMIELLNVLNKTNDSVLSWFYTCLVQNPELDRKRIIDKLKEEGHPIN